MIYPAHDGVVVDAYVRYRERPAPAVVAEGCHGNFLPIDGCAGRRKRRRQRRTSWPSQKTSASTMTFRHRPA